MINSQYFIFKMSKGNKVPHNGGAAAMGLMLLLMSNPLLADGPDEIATDRPDFVESSATVGKNHFQIETSVAYDTKKADGLEEDSYTTPTLLRYGFADDWEARLETDGAIHYETRETATGITTLERGITDLSLGLKWHTHDEDETGAHPAVAWLFHVDVPSGSDNLHGNGLRPSMRAVMEWEFSEIYSFGLMPGVIHDKYVTGERFTAGILGIVTGRAWTEKFRTFLEIAASQITEKKYGGSVVTYDVGGAYLITDMVQADMAISWGATDAAPDFSWTMGLSAKF